MLTHSHLLGTYREPCPVADTREQYLRVAAEEEWESVDNGGFALLTSQHGRKLAAGRCIDAC